MVHGLTASLNDVNSNGGPNGRWGASQHGSNLLPNFIPVLVAAGHFQSHQSLPSRPRPELSTPFETALPLSAYDSIAPLPTGQTSAARSA
jgi:hypothetical protein